MKFSDIDLSHLVIELKSFKWLVTYPPSHIFKLNKCFMRNTVWKLAIFHTMYSVPSSNPLLSFYQWCWNPLMLLDTIVWFLVSFCEAHLTTQLSFLQALLQSYLLVRKDPFDIDNLQSPTSNASSSSHWSSQSWAFLLLTLLPRVKNPSSKRVNGHCSQPRVNASTHK